MEKLAITRVLEQNRDPLTVLQKARFHLSFAEGAPSLESRMASSIISGAIRILCRERFRDALLVGGDE